MYTPYLAHTQFPSRLSPHNCSVTSVNWQVTQFQVPPSARVLCNMPGAHRALVLLTLHLVVRLLLNFGLNSDTQNEWLNWAAKGTGWLLARFVFSCREEDGLGDISTLADTSVVQQLIELRGK